jgi:hypothetical protein
MPDRIVHRPLRQPLQRSLSNTHNCSTPPALPGCCSRYKADRSSRGSPGTATECRAGTPRRPIQNLVHAGVTQRDSAGPPGAAAAPRGSCRCSPWIASSALAGVSIENRTECGNSSGRAAETPGCGPASGPPCRPCSTPQTPSRAQQPHPLQILIALGNALDVAPQVFVVRLQQQRRRAGALEVAPHLDKLPALAVAHRGVAHALELVDPSITCCRNSVGCSLGRCITGSRSPTASRA